MLDVCDALRDREKEWEKGYREIEKIGREREKGPSPVPN